MLALSLLLCLGLPLAWSDNEPYFGVFIPSVLYYPSSDFFCIHIGGDPGKYSFLKINLESEAGTTNLHTLNDLGCHAFHCHKFQVPSPSGTQEKVKIVVQGVTCEESTHQLSIKSVTIRMKKNGTFVQTDKAVYKAGQKVQVRVVTLDQDLQACNEKYTLIKLKDPNNNCLAQWKDVVPDRGIVDFSFPLIDEPTLGDYTITTGSITHRFSVLQYVPPKFEVNIRTPKVISIHDTDLLPTICAWYTFGQPVPGTVTFKICQKKGWSYWWGWRSSSEEKTDLCYHHTAKIDHSGCLKSTVDLRNFRIRDSRYSRQLHIEASLEEEGTGIKIDATSTSCDISSQITKISFRDTKSYFQPGTPFRGKLLLESFNGKPLGGHTVYLTIKPGEGDSIKETYVTDAAGEVTFQLSTSGWGKGSVSLSAKTDDKDTEYKTNYVRAEYGYSYLNLEELYVRRNDALYIRPVKSSAPCHETVTVQVDYSLEGKEDQNMCLYYMVVVKQRIVLSGQKTMEPEKGCSLSGTLEICLPILDISPNGRILVFMVNDLGGVAADTATFQVTPCLKQDATLAFSDDKVLPGSPVNMTLRAEPGSLCALRVVDTSLVLMNPVAELTADKIQKLIEVDSPPSSNERLDYEFCRDKKPTGSSEHDSNYNDVWPPFHSYPVKQKDVQDIIQDTDLTLLSNWKGIVAPVTCKFERMYYAEEAMMDMEGEVLSEPPMSLEGAALDMADGEPRAEANDEESSGAEEEVRKDFPETWLWQLQSIPSTGSEDIQVTAPHTITEWKGQMYCIGDKGFALSPDAALTVFKPYFVEMHLPSCMKRGESFDFKATAFNYLQHALQLAVTLHDSKDLHLKDTDSKVQTFCLCAGEKKTVSWLVAPTKIGLVDITVSSEAFSSEQQCRGQDIVLPEKGQKDTVMQPLLVEPEGTMVERTHNYLLICDGSPVEEQVKLEVPENYVEGSEKASMNAFGDLMSSALNNLDNLLKMSYGCGEQNMVNFAPNVYILKYLAATNQLTAEINTKGCDFLTKGYQRQLSYKHKAGCYSAFGESDGEGSTWLTAFVMKSFLNAVDFIDIEEEYIQKGIKWLEEQQKPNGCFEAKGRVLNNGLKGGVGDEETLTAFVLGALIESGRNPDDPTVKKGFECLKNKSLDDASTFKIAVIAYAYALAGLSDCDELKQILESKAVRADGVVHWTQATKSESDNSSSKPNSGAVEMTSYVLMACMSAKEVSKKDIEDMMPTVRWLSKQQNANGGFCSTQDTVVALQAMAKFALLTYSKAGSVTVTVTSQNGFQHLFHVDDSNRLVLQRVSLPHIPGEYAMSATGEGSVYLQVTQAYHIPPTEREEAFALSAVTQCTQKDLLEIVVEYRYLGDRPSTNMALLEVKMISGYASQRDSIEKIKKNPMVKRVESNDDSVTIYIEEVTSQPQSLVLHAERRVPVLDLKPAITSICDYYMPEQRKTIDYLCNCP